MSLPYTMPQRRFRIRRWVSVEPPNAQTRLLCDSARNLNITADHFTAWGRKKNQTFIDRRDQQPSLNDGKKSCVFADLFYKEQEGKVLSEDQLHLDAKHNEDQFPGVATQEPTQKQQPLEQERFIALVDDHQSCRNKNRAQGKERTFLWEDCVQRLSRYLIKVKVSCIFIHVR